VRTAVALELDSSGFVLTSEDDADEHSVRAALLTSCEPDALLELRAEWGGRSGERSLRLSELPRAARSRTIALALAELLAGLRSPEDVAPESVELAATAPKSEPTSVSDDRAIDRDASFARDTSPERRVERGQAAQTLTNTMAVSAELRSFELQTNTEGLRVHWDFGSWGVGVATLFGGETGQLGVASALIVHGYVEKHLSLVGRPEAAWLTLGPRAGLGVVRVSSTANPGALDATVAEPYLDLASFLEFSTRLSAFRFGARVELGYALGLVALEDDQRLASYAGPFGCVLLDFGLVL
jgi:hypothetical protein